MDTITTTEQLDLTPSVDEVSSQFQAIDITQIVSTIPIQTGHIRKSHATRDRRRECRATQTSPRFDLLLPGEPCALDAEFQRYVIKDEEGNESKCHIRPGRLSIVNTRGDVVLDVYCRYEYKESERKVFSRRDRDFMVERDDFLERNGAVAAEVVEPWVQEIVANRPVVFHGGKQDREMFQLVKNMWAKSTTADTQEMYSHLQRDGTPGLKTCAREVFGANIQEAEHSSVEDAQMTMRLHQKLAPFDRDEAQRKFDASQPKYVHIGHTLNEKVTVPIQPPTSDRFISYGKAPPRREDMSLEDMVVVKFKKTKRKKGRGGF